MSIKDKIARRLGFRSMSKLIEIAVAEGRIKVINDAIDMALAGLTEEEAPKIPFPDFWDAYGHKVDSPAVIKSMWDKLSLKAQTTIMGGVENYVQSVAEKRYRKRPKTFLNSRMWEAEEWGKFPKAQINTAPVQEKLEY